MTDRQFQGIVIAMAVIIVGVALLMRAYGMLPT
jgi:hypothetical protein